MPATDPARALLRRLDADQSDPEPPSRAAKSRCNSGLRSSANPNEVIDADPQGSALDWSEQRLKEGWPRLFGVVGLARDTLHREAPELADHVVIDGAPRIAGHQCEVNGVLLVRDSL